MGGRGTLDHVSLRLVEGLGESSRISGLIQDRMIASGRHRPIPLYLTSTSELHSPTDGGDFDGLRPMAKEDGESDQFDA